MVSGCARPVEVSFRGGTVRARRGISLRLRDSVRL